jgi:pimeloyl-ACP methyl ester carboxylesterase
MGGCVSIVENDGAGIYWDELGCGEPLVLINGLGTTSHFWHRSRPVFAAAYRTIALDNRGVGQSDAPPGIYSISLMASDALAVLNAAGIEEAHVFGVSMGGMIAQELALQHPRRVRSLILGCTSAGDPMGPHAVQPAPDALYMLMRQDLTPAQADEAAVPYLYHAATARERIDEDMAAREKWRPTAQGYIGQLQGVSGWDAYGRLAEIAAPTLLIHGEADRLIPPANARILASRIAGSKLVLLAEAGHIFWTDQPGATHAAILAFLGSLPRR